MTKLFSEMSDLERVNRVEVMADQLKHLFGGQPLMIVAAAMGRVIGETVDTDYVDMFMDVFTDNAELAAGEVCTCGQCNTYTIN